MCDKENSVKRYGVNSIVSVIVLHLQIYFFFYILLQFIVLYTYRNVGSASTCIVHTCKTGVSRKMWCKGVKMHVNFIRF